MSGEQTPADLLHEPELTAPPRPRWFVWATEIALALAFLALLNLVFAPEDPGWRRLSPHPLFLIPALIAVRYGFGPGAIAGLVAGGGHLYAQVQATSGRVSLLEPSLLLLSGLVLGELRQRALMRELFHRDQAEEASREASALRAQLEVEREARAALERRIVQPSRSVTMLYEAAQRLETVEASQLHQAILELLTAHLDVREAAVLELVDRHQPRQDDRPDDGFQLVVRAATGVELGEAQAWREDPLLSAVLERAQTLTLRDLPGPARPEAVVLAAPLLSQEGEVLGALAVRSLPFVRLTSHAARTLSMLGSWSGRALERARYVRRIRENVVYDEQRGVLRHTYFAPRLEEEFDRARRYRYPLAVMALAIEGGEDMPPASKERTLLVVATSLKQVLRTVDQVFCDPEARLFKLTLPHTPPAGAERARERVREALDALALHPYRQEGRLLEVRIGVACYDPSSPESQSVLAEALAREAVSAAEGTPSLPGASGPPSPQLPDGETP